MFNACSSTSEFHIYRLCPTLSHLFQNFLVDHISDATVRFTFAAIPFVNNNAFWQ